MYIFHFQYVTYDETGWAEPGSQIDELHFDSDTEAEKHALTEYFKLRKEPDIHCLYCDVSWYDGQSYMTVKSVLQIIFFEGNVCVEYAGTGIVSKVEEPK